MSKAKKVVSKRMAALLASKADLKGMIKENKKAATLYDRCLTKLYKVEDKIAALEVVEQAKAAKAAARAKK